MSKFIIKGGNKLKGEVEIAGNKNAALPIIAATVLTEEECLLQNVPDIRDVRAMLQLLEYLGKKVTYLDKNTVKVEATVKRSDIDKKMAATIRASILYMGPLLAKLGKVYLPPPGGCVIGLRKVDSHIDVVTALGAKMDMDNLGYKAQLSEPKGTDIFLKESSVTATENALMLASSITETTRIDNAASEPHVSDLANVLVKMGAKITGIGTNRLSITGSKKLKGFTHRIMPDFIEAGTFAIAAAATGGELIIKNAEKCNLDMTVYQLENLGVDLEFLNDNTLHVKPAKLKVLTDKIKVGLWPNFPTDLMSPLIVLATQAQGSVLCHDWMFESRMFFVDKLIAMGANIIQCDPHRVVVNGKAFLRGQRLSSPDIRAGVALVIAALAAEGKSVIDNAELVDRGYEDIVGRLQSIGADIVREE